MGKSQIQFGCVLNAPFVPRKEREAMAQHAQGSFDCAQDFGSGLRRPLNASTSTDKRRPRRCAGKTQGPSTSLGM